MAKPMTKVVAVYRQPKDPKSFDKYFDDAAARDRALASPEGKAVVDDLPKFAAGIVSVYFGEGREP